MRDLKDYYKSKRFYKFHRGKIRSARASHHYYANVHHWRMREWHGVDKFYSS